MPKLSVVADCNPPHIRIYIILFFFKYIYIYIQKRISQNKSGSNHITVTNHLVNLTNNPKYNSPLSAVWDPLAQLSHLLVTMEHLENLSLWMLLLLTTSYNHVDNGALPSALWQTNIAMEYHENTSSKGPFSIAMLVYQSVRYSIVSFHYWTAKSSQANLLRFWLYPGLGTKRMVHNKKIRMKGTKIGKPN